MDHRVIGSSRYFGYRSPGSSPGGPAKGDKMNKAELQRALKKFPTATLKQVVVETPNGDIVPISLVWYNEQDQVIVIVAK